MHWLYALTLALAAFLLFWAELLFGRLLLPLLGGGPGVWITCLLFFQATLLLGYGACRASARWAGTGRQVGLLVGVFLAGGAALPFAVDPALIPKPGSSQTAGLLLLLTCGLGLPFFAVSTLAPLLQAWYGRLAREDSSDPYFLYGASNAGSLLALVLYPLALEPALSLSAQTRLWASAFGVLVLALLACAVVVLRRGAEPSALPPAPTGGVGSLRLRWAWLSFVPACLLYGVTTQITTDIAPMPLLWATPLAIYLGSFVVAFARRRLLPFEHLRALLPVVLVALIVSGLFGNRGPLPFALGLHLGGFAVVACVLHRDLAALRPPAVRGQLESYYLWIALGGLLGGVFHALVAPVLLHTAVEYPWALILAGVLAAVRTVTKAAQRARPAKGEETLPTTAAEALELLALETAHSTTTAPPDGLARTAQGAWAFALGVLACVLISGWSARFFVSNLAGYLLILLLLAAMARTFGVGRLRASVAFVFLVLIGQCALGPLGNSLHIERTFFGVQRVVHDVPRQLYTLHHGTTVHGRQSQALGRRGVPLAYFGREGPAGQVFAALERRGDADARVGVIGLGVGSLATYAREDQTWVFYEIDPATERIARDPKLFSFLADARAPITVVLGDARLSLARTRRTYDLLVLDAFSSDVIPIHLLTREAVGLYMSHLAPGGLLIANVSNRFLDLESVFAAHAAERGLFARVRHDLAPTQRSRDAGITASSWVAVGNAQRDLAGIDSDLRWEELRCDGAPAWTDDHANVLGALRLRR